MITAMKWPIATNTWNTLYHIYGNVTEAVRCVVNWWVSVTLTHESNMYIALIKNYFLVNAAIDHGEWGGPGSCASMLCECDKALSKCLSRFYCPRKRAVCTSSPLRLLQNILMDFGLWMITKSKLKQLSVFISPPKIHFATIQDDKGEWKKIWV